MKINYDLKVGFTAALIGFAAAILITSMGCEYYTEKPVLAGQPNQGTPTDPAACPGELVNGLCTITVEPPAPTPIVCGEGTTLENGICVASVSCPDGTVVDGVCVPPADEPALCDGTIVDGVCVPPAEGPAEPTSPWSGITAFYDPVSTRVYSTPPPPDEAAATETEADGDEGAFGPSGPTVPASGGLSEEGELVSAGVCSDIRRDGPNVVGVGLHTFAFSPMSDRVRMLTGIYLDCRKTGEWIEAAEITAEPEDDSNAGIRRLPGDNPPPTPQETWDHWIRHLDHAALLDEAEEDPNDRILVGSAAPAGHILVGVKLMKCGRTGAPSANYCGAKGLFRRVPHNGREIQDENPISIGAPENRDYAPDTDYLDRPTGNNPVIQCPDLDQVVTGIHFRRKHPGGGSINPEVVTWVDLTCSRISTR